MYNWNTEKFDLQPPKNVEKENNGVLSLFVHFNLCVCVCVFDFQQEYGAQDGYLMAI